MYNFGVTYYHEGDYKYGAIKALDVINKRVFVSHDNVSVWVDWGSISLCFENRRGIYRYCCATTYDEDWFYQTLLTLGYRMNKRCDESVSDRIYYVVPDSRMVTIEKSLSIFEVAKVSSEWNYSGDWSTFFDRVASIGLGGDDEMEVEEQEVELYGTDKFRKGTYALTDDEREYLLKEMEILYDTYDYEWNETALNDIVDEWVKEKGWLISLFKRSPYYVDGKFMLSIPTNFRISMNKPAISEFAYWWDRQITKFKDEKQKRFGCLTYSEMVNIKGRLGQRVDAMKRCVDLNIKATYLGADFSEVLKEYEDYTQRITRIYHDADYRIDSDRAIPTEDYKIAEEAISFFYFITSNSLDKFIDYEGKLTKTGSEQLGKYLDIPHSEGMKLMRYVAKLAKKLGCDTVVDLQTITFTDSQGVCHEKQKDMGWNGKRVALGEAIMRPPVKDNLYLSLNPIDYLTMSFLRGVASCHTIDKKNRRDCTSSYSGEYSSGTMSYMLDDVSFVGYMLYHGDSYKEYKGELSDDITRKTKLRRAMYVLDENKLFMSRLYPDGRDGGDQDMASNWLNIVEEHIADLLEVDNTWERKRGYIYNDLLVRNDGATLYNDFEAYSDVFTNTLVYKGHKNTNRVFFGAEPICINCGCRHDYSEAIECYDCWDGSDAYYCDCCGERISDAEDAIYIGDHIYCCHECAEESEARYCEDIDEWAFDWWYSDYEEVYYSDNETEERVYIDYNRWEGVSQSYAEDHFVWDDYKECWVDTSYYWYDPDGNCFTDIFFDDTMVTTADGEYFPTADEAEKYGYVLNEETDEYEHVA